MICQIIAGSHLFGLETPESDIDYRGVFINADYQEILGLNEHKIIKKESEDLLFFELRHYLSHLKKSNVSSIELLFAENFQTITEEFKIIQENKYSLIDSNYLFSSLTGYIQGELRLANGERTGALGSKRKAQIEKYGFSPKNFSHLIRLAYCGEMFFKNSIFPVNLKGHEIHELIYKIKTQPQNYSKSDMNLLSQDRIARLGDAYESRGVSYRFDVELANKLCLRFYLPFLEGINIE